MAARTPRSTLPSVTADAKALRRVVEGIASIGSHPRGFRATGTPEEHAVAELVADEMRAIGTYALIARQGQAMASILSTW